MLYCIDTGDVDEKLNRLKPVWNVPKRSMQRRKKNYNKATEDYQSLDYVSPEEGYVQTVYVEVGDTVKSGDKLVDLYNDRTMVLKVPF